MKFALALLFLASLVFAEPESEATADPAADAWYSYYGHPGYYGHRYYGYPGYYGHRYGYGYWGRKKREAEADPAVLASTSAVTAPQTVYAHHPYAYAYGAPYLHYQDPVAAPVTYTHPVAYAHHAGVYGYPYGLPYVYPAPVVKAAEKSERKKREAEAEPEADAAADAWYSYYGHPGYYGYGHRYYGYGGYYGHPYGYGYRYGWGK